MSIASVLSHWLRRLTAPPAPMRLRYARRVRLVPALAAGFVATLVFLALYYATLDLLPWVYAYPVTRFPVGAWAHRLDLAQFIGSFLYPPYPTPFTWELGFVVLFGSLIGLALVYALLLAWTLQTSDVGKGLGFGLAAALGLAAVISIANGLHPAIMRNALPDTGLLLLGWSNWAPLQLLFVHGVYGAVLGRLYQTRP